MPFVRVSRDKRGYERIYLVHVATHRGKPSRPRLLYWFRTPPGVTVGREPFDPSVRRALEAQHPEVAFDWDKLVKMAISSLDAEPWRERRRAEHAGTQPRRAGESDRAGSFAAAQAEEKDSRPTSGGPIEGFEAMRTGEPGDTSEPAASVTAAWPVLTPDVNDRGSEGLSEVEIDGLEDGVHGSDVKAEGGGIRAESAESAATLTAASGDDSRQPLGRRRRRRRGSRRRRASLGSGPASTTLPPDSSKSEEPIG